MNYPKVIKYGCEISGCMHYADWKYYDRWVCEEHMVMQSEGKIDLKKVLGVGGIYDCVR